MLGEHLVCTQEVASSRLAGSTKNSEQLTADSEQFYGLVAPM